jgi:chromosome segregation ATPase
MNQELTVVAQFIGVILISGITYWVGQRKNKNKAEAVEQHSKDYADNLIKVQSARVTDLENQINTLEREVKQLQLQLEIKQSEITNITRERDLAIKNQGDLQQQLRDSQAALTATLQQAEDMEKRLESLEKQQVGSDAVKQFIDQVMSAIKMPPVPVEVKAE